MLKLRIASRVLTESSMSPHGAVRDMRGKGEGDATVVDAARGPPLGSWSPYYLSRLAGVNRSRRGCP